ncbi:MAG: hypothetical protein JNL32_07650 [Candidatus Kapabacteria bacterium]|nr:hypothetical protein [Candidatus Kapabacteria bacterium]
MENEVAYTSENVPPPERLFMVALTEREMLAAMLCMEGWLEHYLALPKGSITRNRESAAVEIFNLVNKFESHLTNKESE